MAPPVVSEEESLRERLRLAAEEATRLANERVRIEAQLAASPRSRVWLVGLVVSGVLGAFGVAAARTFETRRMAERQLLEERHLAQAAAREELALAECHGKEVEARRALDECEVSRVLSRLKNGPIRDIASEPDSPITAPRRSPTCRCQVGDPLCSCL